ncbi:MAG: YggS family pyridoxal phosphate-dependent enzyme [Thermodesulfobacteriota bacterium]
MISANLSVINKRIARAAAAAGRAPEEITLIAVSKRQPRELISQALTAGQLDFGENYLQEAEEKIKVITGPVRWHFIGRLQSNKAKKAVRDFDLIHTVDRLKLARGLDRAAASLGKKQKILVQVNVGREAQKGGVLAEKCQELLENLKTLANLKVRGLMTMPPQVASGEEARPYFAKLRELADQMAGQGLLPATPALSMGMSGDFEAAILEGATMVRVGTAIFGARE